MSLAIFDLDDTLIAGDSDYLWGEFLVEHNLVDKELYHRQNERFFKDYQEGKLDIDAYLAFALAPLTQFNPMQLQQLHQRFMGEKIEAIILPAAHELIDQHRQQGHTPMIITSTNRFVTGPIANALGIDHLLASEPEVVDGVYTGRAIGTPCFQEGKVKRLNEWLAEHKRSLDGSYFYSDSANDIPLLDKVDNPVAVDPDDRLRAYAEQNSIPIMSLR